MRAARPHARKTKQEDAKEGGPKGCRLPPPILYGERATVRAPVAWRRQTLEPLSKLGHMAGMTKTPAPNTTVTVGNAVFSNTAPLALIAGPCQLESRGHAF